MYRAIELLGNFFMAVLFLIIILAVIYSVTVVMLTAKGIIVVKIFKALLSGLLIASIGAVFINTITNVKANK